MEAFSWVFRGGLLGFSLSWCLRKATYGILRMTSSGDFTEPFTGIFNSIPASSSFKKTVTRIQSSRAATNE